MQRPWSWQFPLLPPGPIQDPADLLVWMGVSERFTVGDLIRAGSLDLRLAAVLWTLLARRACIIVAAGPRLVGKSTTLTALLDMLPTNVAFFPVGGSFSRDRAHALQPKDVYLVVNEISEHIPGRYLWGRDVHDLFMARAEGYSFAATLHADSPQEVVQALAAPPLRIPLDLVALIDVVLILRDGYFSTRGVETAYLADVPGPDGRPVFQPVSAWDPERRVFRHADLAATADLIGRRLVIPHEDITREFAARESYLSDLVANPPPSDGWRGALGRFTVQGLAT